VAVIGIRQVADEAGVSPALVSLALNDRPGVAAETRARIVAVADRLGYNVNQVARSLRTGRTGVLGLVVRNFANPYFLDVASGAQAVTHDAHSTILIADSDYSAERESEHVRRLLDARADALAIAPVGGGAVLREWVAARPATPLIAINATVKRIAGVIRVGPDNRHAVRLAVDHLASLGHRRIAFLRAPGALMADHDRLDEFATLCSALSLEPCDLETQLTVDHVRARVESILADPRPPTAIITNSDHTAHAVYMACRSAGAVVGSDISVVGHDDLPTSALLDPPLTTIAVDRRSIGSAVGERLLGRSRHHHVEPVSLVQRASTAPPRRGSNVSRRR
jgi:DNA-binding LacI/PurR family transcriptional regulator